MPLALGFVLAGVALMAAWVLDGYVSQRRDRCTEMLGMMVGMVAGMMTGLVIGEVAGSVTNMFWGNLLGLLVAVPLGGYLGRQGQLLGILDGAMAGVMGGMMGAMLGVMLQFSPEYALATGVVLLVAQLAALVAVAQLVAQCTAPPAGLPDYYEALGIAAEGTPRGVAAAYVTLTDSGPDSPERLRLADEALAVLGDPIRRLAYDRARAAAMSDARPADPPPSPHGAAAVDPSHQEEVGPGRPAGWGALAVVVFAAVAFGLVAARPATAACPPSTAGEANSPDRAAVGEKQVVDLTIQYPCYYPDRITVQRGVPVQFNVGTVGDPGCGRIVVFQGLGVRQIVSPGQITTFEFTPERAGSYSITCSMGMMRPATLRVAD